MSSIVSQITAGIFLAIMTFLIITNYKGMTEIMKQGGTTISQVSKTLQGR
jgi:hypothetical protein